MQVKPSHLSTMTMTRTRRRPPHLTALLLVGLVGCDNPFASDVCTLGASAAVEVRVEDAISGQPLAAGSTLLLREGAFVDSVAIPLDATGFDDRPLVTPNSIERAGTYEVIVRRAGYAEWARADVVVTAGRCNVRTVRLTAQLQLTE